MTQDEIRQHLGSNGAVHTQVAAEGDGSPRIAWGDTFFFVRGEDGKPGSMPFTTMVTKDYDAFDVDSRLDRGGLYRLNIEVGKGRFEKLFGFKPAALAAHRDRFDFTTLDQLFPHPLYGPHGWVSIINPAGQRATVIELLDFSLDRALGKGSARA